MSAQPPPPPPPPSAWEKEHLWLFLLALGFDPERAAARRISTHLCLGPNIFDKPNKDAFTIVAHFLFSNVDQSHCNEIFREYIPNSIFQLEKLEVVLYVQSSYTPEYTDKKADSEFRKHSYEWLRRISDEHGNNFPPVVASLFLSPGGYKFIHLMYSFARYVIMQHVKVDSAGSGISYAEAVNSRPPDSNIAIAKYNVAQNRFLHNLQKEDFLIQELHKKALCFSKRIRDLKFENADLDKQLQKMEKGANPSQSNTAEGVEKVRYLWTQITEMLAHLQKEIEVVDSVVKGHIDQYVLDGTSVAINVPRPLLEKVEKDMLQFHLGNVYEEGKLNVLTVIHLLNKALEILMHERWHIDKNALKLDLQYMEGKTKYQNVNLQGLKSLRQKLKHEDCVSIKQSISKKQQEWDLKWKGCLGHLIKNPDPALDLLPAMSPLSFSPATEEAYKSSVFCQYPASIPDATKKNFQKTEFEVAGKESRCQGSSAGETVERMTVPSSSLVTASENETWASSEKGSVPETPKAADHSSYHLLRHTGRNSRPMKTVKKKQAHTFKTPSSIKRDDPLKKAKEQLAEQMADVVASNSPQSAQGGGQDLEDLIGTLISDPFLARKQIPRTPENLITEIRSSWKKAIQDEEASSVELNHMEAVKDVPEDRVPAPRNQIDLSIAESIQVLPAGAVEEVLWKQGSTPDVPGKGESVNPELDLKTEHAGELDDGPWNSITAETLPPYMSQNSSLSTTVSWDGLPVGSGSDSQDVVQLSILQETLPEEGTLISLNSSCNNLEPDEVRGDSPALADCVAGSERQQDLQSIQRRLETLKKTMFENSLSSKMQMPRCRSEFSLSPVSMEAHSVLSPLGKPYASDAELAPKPSHTTLLERKLLLSPLASPSSTPEREHLVLKDRGDLLNEK